MLICQDDCVLFIFLRVVFGVGDSSLEGYVRQLLVRCSAASLKDVTRTISNLSAIPLQTCDLSAVEIFLGCSIQAHIASSFRRELVGECLPYLSPLATSEVWVVKLCVNTRNEGIIECADSVCREEEYAIVELKSSEESCESCEREWPLKRLTNDLPATKLLRSRSVVDRLSMNTSASSINRTAPQLFACLKLDVKFSSTSFGFVPISLQVRIIKGRRVYSAMHSTQRIQISGHLYAATRTRSEPLPAV